MKAPWVRPATASDLPAIAALTGRPSRLPESAHEHLLVAEAAAADRADPGDTLEAGPPRLLAALRLVPAIGLQRPRLWYHVGCTVHAAAELGLFHRQRTLLLGHDHTGASECCDIAWLPVAGQLALHADALQLLVRSAALLMARQRSAYAESLVVELPGPRDAAGQSPFWSGLGRHFYAGDPAAAAAQHGPEWRSLVAALLPRQLLYTSFLPPAAQAAIAQVQAEALLLRDVLEAAGLRYSHHINLEDGGPVMEAATDALAGLAAARCWAIREAAPAAGTPPMLLMAGAPGHWRALRAPAMGVAGELAVSPETMAALGSRNGEPAWAMPLG
jgi:arginine N-succinyltransferase